MHKSIVSRFAIFIFLFILPGCAAKISYNSPQFLKKTTSSIVKISVDYIIKDKITLATVQKIYFATGFSIIATDAVSFILTNQHVCDLRGNANYTLTMQSGKKIPATFIRSDAFADICLLTTKTVIPPLQLAQKNASQGDRIITIGGPDGVFPLFVDGLVSGYYNIHMRSEPDGDGDFEVNFRSQVISAPVYPGSSGSPVLDINGEVIGIVFAVRGEKEHIAFIVPINEVWRFLQTEEYVHMN